MHTTLRFARLSLLAPLALLASLALLGGCSSGSFEVARATDASAGDAADAVVDVGADTGKHDDAALPEAGSFECADPGGCGPLKPHCCVTYDLGNGTFPQCPASNVQTKCQATCPTQFPISCPASGRLKLCRNGDDCLSDMANPKCCNVLQSTGSTTGGYACVSEQIASFGGLSCK